MEESSEISEHVSEEKGKKKIKKNVDLNPDGAKLPCRIDLDYAPENYMMMAMNPATFGPYWNSMQQPMPSYYMSYGPSPTFRGMLPFQDPFGAMCPTMPYMLRDLSELAMGFNAETPVTSRELFEATKPDLKSKRQRFFFLKADY